MLYPNGQHTHLDLSPRKRALKNLPAGLKNVFGHVEEGLSQLWQRPEMKI